MLSCCIESQCRLCDPAGTAVEIWSFIRATPLLWGAREKNIIEVAAQMAELNPQIHFSPMKSPERRCSKPVSSPPSPADQGAGSAAAQCHPQMSMQRDEYETDANLLEIPSLTLCPKGKDKSTIICHWLGSDLGTRPIGLVLIPIRSDYRRGPLRPSFSSSCNTASHLALVDSVWMT